MKKINSVKWLAIIFFLIPMLFILLFPFIVMISTSFKTLREVSQIPRTFIPHTDVGELPRGVEHHSAGEALPQQPLPGLRRDGDRAVPGHPGSVLAVPFPVRRPGPYMIFLLFTQMFSPVVMILGIFRLVAAYGLVDNLAVVAVIAASFNLAFCIWLLTGYFSAIPPEIERPR